MVYLKHIALISGAIPLLPYMLFQGIHIRKKIPKLPPPTDIAGTVGTGNNPINLLAIGESTIAGIGVKTHRDGITGQLADYLSKKTNRRITWEVFAKSGLTSKGILEKLQDEPIQMKPDIIVIGTGANDGFRLNNPLFFKNNISKIINLLKIKFPDIPIVFANLPPIQSFPAFPFLVKFFVGKIVDQYGEELIKIAAKHPKVHFDDAKIRELNWGTNGASTNDFFSDGVHPSKLAYQLWAQRIGGFILENKIVQLPSGAGQTNNH